VNGFHGEAVASELWPESLNYSHSNDHGTILGLRRTWQDAMSFFAVLFHSVFPILGIGKTRLDEDA